MRPNTARWMAERVLELLPKGPHHFDDLLVKFVSGLRLYDIETKNPESTLREALRLAIKDGRIGKNDEVHDGLYVKL